MGGFADGAGRLDWSGCVTPCRRSRLFDGTMNYVCDPSRSAPVVLVDSTFKYVYGLGLVYAVTGGVSLGVCHTDGLGSVRAVTNGNLVEAYLTDAFGVSLGTEGTVTQPFGFTDQQQDAESGLNYLRARYYSPTLGRFISRDPTFGALTNPLSLNRFGYTLDNPGLPVDPSGLSVNRVTRKGRRQVQRDHRDSRTLARSGDQRLPRHDRDVGLPAGDRPTHR